MKVTKLSIKNIGILADVCLALDKPLILFYGEIKQGKTTLLNAVRLLFGGEFPSDVIRHGADKASVTLEFDGGVLERTFYRSKAGDTEARPLTFVRDGRPVPSPVSEVKRLLNPFLLNQNHLLEMGETERKRFFAELFATDTKQLDNELFTAQRNAEALRSELKGFGEIDLTKHERVEVGPLREQLLAIERENEGFASKARDEYAAAVRHNNEVLRVEKQIFSRSAEMLRLEEALSRLKEAQAKDQQWIQDNPRKDAERHLNVCVMSTREIEDRIAHASAQNVRAEQYEKNLKRAGEKKAKELQLSELEAKQRNIRSAKIAKLKEVSDTCGIPGLSFDEHGNFFYQGTQASMLSTSQIMELSSALSSLYPEGFGLDLIDRGESLGKSIFQFVDRAKAENKTILATIVGEKPAKVPDDVGVFVVESGKVSAA